MKDKIVNTLLDYKHGAILLPFLILAAAILVSPIAYSREGSAMADGAGDNASDLNDQPSLYDFSFQSMDLKYVLSEIAAMAQAKLQIDTELNGKVNLQMKQVSIAHLLNYLIKSYKNSSHNKSFLSEHGTMIIDERGRQLIIRDTQEYLKQIAEIIKRLDQPQKQILLEANIVMAKTSAAKDLGIRWGAQITRNNITFGTLQSDFANLQGRFTTPLAVDLGVINEAAARFQINHQGRNSLIELELSALELEGQIDIISKPKVATIDGQTARISSGVEVPFVVSDNNEINTSFKEATLSLEVKVRIIENENIAMEINISQDTVGELYDGFPSIDTNKLHTQLRTANQQTVVLGGILQTRRLKQISKVPFLGDLPILKWLFRRESQIAEKAELLIFITPRIIN